MTSAPATTGRNNKLKRREDLTTNLRNEGNSIEEFEQKAAKAAKEENGAAFIFLGTKSKNSAPVLLEKYPRTCVLIGAAHIFIPHFRQGALETSSLFTGSVAEFFIPHMRDKNAATLVLLRVLCVLLFKLFDFLNFLN